MQPDATMDVNCNEPVVAKPGDYENNEPLGATSVDNENNTLTESSGTARGLIPGETPAGTQTSNLTQASSVADSEHNAVERVASNLDTGVPNSGNTTGETATSDRGVTSVAVPWQDNAEYQTNQVDETVTGERKNLDGRVISECERTDGHVVKGDAMEGCNNTNLTVEAIAQSKSVDVEEPDFENVETKGNADVSLGDNTQMSASPCSEPDIGNHRESSKDRDHVIASGDHCESAAHQLHRQQKVSSVDKSDELSKDSDGDGEIKKDNDNACNADNHENANQAQEDSDLDLDEMVALNTVEDNEETMNNKEQAFKTVVQNKDHIEPETVDVVDSSVIQNKGTRKDNSQITKENKQLPQAKVKSGWAKLSNKMLSTSQDDEEDEEDELDDSVSIACFFFFFSFVILN